MGMVAVVLGPVVARADITLSVENPNSRGVVDHFELYDLVCGRDGNPLTLAGRTSGVLTVCGGLDQPGGVRIRYEGEQKWTDFPELHSWSVIMLPERPASRRRSRAQVKD